MHLPRACGIFGLLMATLLHVALTFPVDESALAQRESYLAADEVFGPELKERGEREKRKGGGFLEPIVEASFGVKSRVIGLIFGKINQLIDSKNRWVDQLDRKNIELNKRVIANQNCNTVGTELAYPPVPAVPNKVALLAQLSSSSSGSSSSSLSSVFSASSASGSSSSSSDSSAAAAPAPPSAPEGY